MRRSAFGRLTLAAIACCMLLSFWPMPAAVAQPRGEVADPAMAAAFYSRLEAEGRFAELYAYMHPDAQAIIPEAAVVGWYQHEFAPLGPGVSTVTGVQWVTWTWEVTGAAYPQTAVVAFRQPFANGTVTEDVVRLVAVDGEWRWFFGRTRAFVDEQLARYAGAPVAAAPAASQSGASCDGDAVWWAETNTRMTSTAYLAYTFPSTSIASAGDAQLMRSYADSFANLLAAQQATSPPPAAQAIQNDFIAALENYAFAADTYASNSGGQASAAEARANADRIRSGLAGQVQTFIDTCHPVVVFLSTLGGDTPPAPVLPGEPAPQGFMPLDCQAFETPTDAQRFFDASGPGDMYGLDADGDGKACEPGE